MKIKISDEVGERHKDLKIGVVFVQGFDNSKYPDDIRIMKRNAESYVKFQFRARELREHSRLKAWREVYKGYGGEGGCSAEWLIERVLKKGELPSVNALVDIYNLVSAREVIPIGGSDTDKVKGGIILKLSPGEEKFVAIGGKEEKTKKGEIVYADDEKILCRMLNSNDCDATKFTEETKNVVLLLEALGGDDMAGVKRACKDLKQIIEKYGDAEVNTYFIDGTREIELGNNS